jgi:hypothetical protein
LIVEMRAFSVRGQGKADASKKLNFDPPGVKRNAAKYI